MNIEHYKMAQSFAVEYGTILGILWLITFALVIGGLVTGNLISSLAGLAAFGIACIMPFYLAWRFKQHLDEGERVSTFIAWTFTFLMFTYASIMAGVGHLVYFTYIDQGQLMNTFHQTLFSPEAEAQYRAIGATDMLQTARQQFDLIQGLTPFEITLALFENNIFLALLLTIPATFVAHRKSLPLTPPKEGRHAE